MHLLQAVCNLFETLAQPRLQRGLQFFIDRGSHLIQLCRIGGLQLRQLDVQGLSNFRHAPGIGLTQARELGA